MGLWIQNVAVQAPSLPSTVAARTAAESFGLPERMEGWSWASLAGWEEGGDGAEVAELDELAAAAAHEARAPALAFSVHDSDSVYLVGADEAGIRFRLVVNSDAWGDDAPPPQDVDEAVAWASEHAPLPVSADALREALARRYVFAEEGLDVVFARLGLLSTDPAQTVELEDDDWAAIDAEVADLDEISDPLEADMPVGSRRWYAEVSGFQGREDEQWLMIASGSADGAATVLRTLAGRSLTVWFCRRGEPLRELFDPGRSLVDIAADMRGPAANLRVGEWHEIPREVPRTLEKTAAWVLDRSDS